ncbi:MAG: hypothetical protein QOF33_4311, partial [Thermomicrobiales bacterium]|nr:hypothetical protein [Thermomicrobiales bacterium]
RRSRKGARSSATLRESWTDRLSPRTRQARRPLRAKPTRLTPEANQFSGLRPGDAPRLYLLPSRYLETRPFEGE